MDLVGPLPRTSTGHRYILVICDYGTRYPEAVLLKDIQAETVAEQLVLLFSPVGIPMDILTDQGANFMSALLKELYTHASTSLLFEPVLITLNRMGWWNNSIRS